MQGPDRTPARHGEYKVPGGKLVVIDLNLQGNLLSDVRISGDFFLEPPEGLDDLNRALEGVAIDTPDAQIIARLNAALRPESEMFGFSAEAVVVVLRRALA
ncbi:MAG: biotin--protein ligase [Alcaligenaceae bacterium]|nr:MAG: biotin--protein ligase [Alcaligenaceae bacterium]